MAVQYLILLLLILRASLDGVLNKLAIGVGGGQITGGAVLNMVVIACGASVCISHGRILLQRAFLWAWTPFLLIAALGVMYSPEKIQAIRVFLVYLTYGAMFSLGYWMNLNKNTGTKSLNTLVLASVIPIFYTPVQVVLTGFSSGEWRASSVFSHPNIFGFFLMVVTGYFVHCYLKYRMNRYDRLFLLVLIAAACVCLILTQTRGAWASFYAFGLIYAAIAKPRLIAPMAILPLVGLLVPSVQNRIVQLLDGSGSNVDLNYMIDIARGLVSAPLGFELNSYVWRTYMWQAAGEWIVKNPIFGYGLESFPYYSPTFFPLSTDAGNAHNVFVQIAFELGGLGLLAYLWLIIIVVRISFRRNNSDRYDRAFVIGILIAYHLAAYSDNMLYYLSVNWYFWFLLGTFCAGSSTRIIRKRVSNGIAHRHHQSTLQLRFRSVASNPASLAFLNRKLFRGDESAGHIDCRASKKSFGGEKTLPLNNKGNE